MRLRCDVFVVEQECAYPELDGLDVDPGTEHHWIRSAGGEGSIACCARTLTEAAGRIRIGRVATVPEARGNGLAATMVGVLIDRFAGDELVLDAQSQLVGWYERLGFTVCGDEFVEDGIPHVPMEMVRR